MKRVLVMFAAIALLAPTLAVIQPPQSSEAANAALFNPGYIISDSAFYDGQSMSAAAVQEFLQQRVTNCTSGFICLRDYRQATPTIAPTSLCPGTYIGSTSDRASDIIAKAGAACNISPRVLIVLLEKEQSLVTSRSPSTRRYAAATGFGCPDTAPCDPAFSGFFYQVYNAARQFQNYRANPARWNYQPGRVNSILYHPNTACGRGDVFIQNSATAALYIYTPYQPNAAAMNNLYGVGDGCSAYGNRNFWRIFSDWFGSPTEGSSLVRTVANSSVYLTSGTNKYPITSMATLNALFPLGQVGYVSQAYLDAFTTAHPVGRVLRGPDGSIYFFDAGYKLGFPSCDLVIDYGGSCDATGFVQLSDMQIRAFATGPTLSNVLGTNEGARYSIQDGIKREILDSRSQTEAGLPADFTVLSENAVSSLPFGPPIIRDSVFVSGRGTSSYSLHLGGLEYQAEGSAASLGMITRSSGSLWPTSLAEIPNAATSFNGRATSASNPIIGLLTDWGRYNWAEGIGGYSTAGAVAVSDELMATYSNAGTVAIGSMFKTATNGTIYVTMPRDLKPIGSWSAMLSLSPGGAVDYSVVSQRVVDSAVRGIIAMTAGSLVRSPGNATIYIVNGVTNRIPLSDFDYTTEAGVTGFEVFPESFIQGYPQSSANLGFGWSCGTDFYVAAGGSLHKIAAGDETLWPISYTPIDSFTCALMKYGEPATKFVRTVDGSIFMLESGVKRPIPSYARFLELGGGAAGYLNVHWRLSAQIPTGPVA